MPTRYSAFVQEAKIVVARWLIQTESYLPASGQCHCAHDGIVTVQNLHSRFTSAIAGARKYSCFCIA